MHASFHYAVVRPLYELIEDYMVRMMHEQSFILEASAICSNVSSLSNRRKHYVLLYLLDVMQMVDNEDD